MNILTKTKLHVLTLLASVSFFVSQAQETRNPGEFTGIKVGDSFEIVLSQSESNSIKIDASEVILARIKTEVKEGVLSIFSEGELKSDKTPIIYINVKNITSLNITGAADIKTKNQLICNNMNIESTGAGDILLDIKADEIKSRISGAGDVTLKGSSLLLDVNVSGAGNLKATELESAKVIVKVAGAGDAKVNAKQSIDADVSGAGSVIYKGNPVDRNVSITGAGSVRESKLGTGEETARDTTKFKLGNKKYMIIGDGEDNYSPNDSSKKIDFKHWSGWELGINGLLDYKNSLDAPDNGSFLELDYAKSVQFGLNLFEKDFHIYKDYVNLVVGFGFDFNHYALKNNVTLNGDTTFLNAFNDKIDYKKNTLNVSYIKVPLLIEFNTSKNPNQDFHIAIGGEFAYRIHAVAKQKYDMEDVHYKLKQRDDFNLEPFRYSATARIGYNNVTVFANYGLNRLFQKNKGPQVYPFTLGVTFSFS